MTFLRILTSWLLICGAAHADTWTWEYTAGEPTPTVFFECGPTTAGPWTVLAEVPSFPASYAYTPTITTSCRVRNLAGVTNIVTRVVTATTTDLTVTMRLSALETNLTTLQARVTTLEAGPVVVPPPPAPSSNLTMRVIDADHVEIVGTNCLNLRTTGTGLRRIVECGH